MGQRADAEREQRSADWFEFQRIMARAREWHDANPLTPGWRFHRASDYCIVCNLAFAAECAGLTTPGEEA